MLEAEWTRDVAGITPEDLAHRDYHVRRTAVRALARAAKETSRAAFERALADEDSDVVAWAAFGLGRLCKSGDVAATIRRIVARAGTLALSREGNASGASDATLDKWFALAQALGRCGGKEAERVLRSWIAADPDLARAAVQGLDYLAQSNKDLEPSTVVALLDAAEKDRHLVVALLAISRLPRLEPLVARRLVAMAPRLLESAGEERRFLLRALPLAGKDALGLLERVVVDDGHYRPFERVEAIRALGKLDALGQAALARLVPRLWNFGGAPSEAELLSPKWAIWVELFEQLKEAPKSAHATLAKLANVEALAGRKPSEYRRIASLRCHAAALISAGEPNAVSVARCDSTESQRERKLAQLLILDRMAITGRFAGILELLLVDRDPMVAIAALDVLAHHDEVVMRTDLITAALGADSMGIVAAAARALVAHPPHRERRKQPDAELATAIDRALAKDWPPDAVEVRVALMDAAAELGYLNVKSRILADCGSPIPWLREHAERALRRLGEPNKQCNASVRRALPPEADHSLDHPVTLRFHTEDLGVLELRLDPNLARLAVTRVVDLAKRGFYDGIAVHRVVPGFVVQLGDRSGDGFGGAGQPTLPCELAPRPFGPLDVGMALSGADSGSSQFFATLGPYPQLGGDYTNIGRAGVGWDQLYPGDRIQKVEVVP